MLKNYCKRTLIGGNEFDDLRKTFQFILCNQEKNVCSEEQYIKNC